MRRLGISNIALRHWAAVVALMTMVSGMASVCGAADAEEVDFNRDVRPILANCCYECHGPDEDSRKADLRLDRQDALFDESRDLVVAGDPAASELYLRLSSDDPDLVMPPEDAHRKPTREQIEIIRRWIEQGAKFAEHWAFIPPQRWPIPKVSDENWCHNEIDHFVLAKLDRRGLKPQPPADAGVLARRLSLSLTGLPPTEEEYERFIAAYHDDPQTAVLQWVDELLSRPQYGEHFAWAWLDAARYADTNGYQGDGQRTMWPWRDWLVRSLNTNMPLDQMTEQMLAGDLLMPKPHRDWESADWIEDAKAAELLLATGFLRNHRYDTGSGTIPAESIFENAVDRMETVGTVWMGLTFQCARCHTHKFDPIENREYYQMLSLFDNVPEVGSALRGASHPYIHVAPPEARKELLRLRKTQSAAQKAFAAATANLKNEQQKWEQSLASDDAPPPRVGRGLKHRFAAETLRLDGKTTIKKSNAPVSMCAGNKKWTISLWVRPSGDDKGAIFSSVEEPERYRPGIQADWIDRRIRLRHVCRWVNSYIEFESAEQLQPDRWYHITFRCDGRMQGLAYWASLDGDDNAMRCTHPVTNDSAGNAGKAPLVLGGSPLMPSFVGSLRDLRFYNRVLEPAEIASLADARATAEIARIPTHERTEQDAATLRLAFLESDALPKEIAALQDRLFETNAAVEAAVKKLPTTMVMQEVALGQTRIRRSGVYDNLGDVVDDGTPSFLPPIDSKNVDRLELARWLMHPEHPLTARVAVNRIWQQLWGHGFVDSPENFGTQCAQPQHAKLMDWLATEYIRSGWDTKALVKLIVTSAAFAQDSSAPEGMWRRDPQNQFLARGPRYRLPVSVVRDQSLALGGLLDTTVGGPPMAIDEVRGKDEKVVKGAAPVQRNRRTIYTFWKRNAPHPLLAVFDAADRNQCDVRVRRTNSPLQSLVTLNEAMLVESARGLAKQIEETDANNDRDKVCWAYRRVTGRQAEDSDTKLLQSALSAYREHFREKPEAAAKLSGDADCDPAWVALANVLLNLDAALTLE